MKDEVLVSNIQRFCLHDGPGIRTTVFLKGCNLHCPWCANPENICQEREKCFWDTVSSKNGTVYGNWMSLEFLIHELKKDIAFYNHGGGVTLSGGEPLLVFPKLVPLLDSLRNDGISLCTETALFTSGESVKTALQYLETFIIDIKILDNEICRKVLGGNLENYMSNIQIIDSSNVNVIYRVPLIKPYTTNSANIDRITSFLRNKRYTSVELIKGHNLAEKKYQSLNRERYVVPELSDEELSCIQEKFLANEINAVICKI